MREESLFACFGQSSGDGVFFISSSTSKPRFEIAFIRWLDKEHEGLGQGGANLLSPLHIDVQDDHSTGLNFGFDGSAGCAVAMPTEDFGMFQQLVGLDHRQKCLVVHEVVIHPLCLLRGLRPRGHAYREQPVHLGQDLPRQRGLSDPRGAGEHQQQS